MTREEKKISSCTMRFSKLHDSFHILYVFICICLCMYIHKGLIFKRLVLLLARDQWKFSSKVYLQNTTWRFSHSNMSLYVNMTLKAPLWGQSFAALLYYSSLKNSEKCSRIQKMLTFVLSWGAGRGGRELSLERSCVIMEFCFSS